MAFASHARLIPASDIAAMDKELRQAMTARDRSGANLKADVNVTEITSKVVQMKITADTDDHLWMVLEEKLADRSRQNQSLPKRMTFADRVIGPVKSLFRRSGS